MAQCMQLIPLHVPNRRVQSDRRTSVNHIYTVVRELVSLRFPLWHKDPLACTLLRMCATPCFTIYRPKSFPQSYSNFYKKPTEPLSKVCGRWRSNKWLNNSPTVACSCAKIFATPNALAQHRRDAPIHNMNYQPQAGARNTSETDTMGVRNTTF